MWNHWKTENSACGLTQMRCQNKTTCIQCIECMHCARAHISVHVQESQEQHQKANDAIPGIACLTVVLALQR